MKFPFKIIDYDGWKLWTKLFQQWLSEKFEGIAAAVGNIHIDFSAVESKLDDVKTDVGNVGEKIDALDEKVTPYLYDLCTAEDIDHMFDANTEDGQIIIPAEAVQPDGSISLNLFTAITGLTPVVANNEQG